MRTCWNSSRLSKCVFYSQKYQPEVRRQTRNVTKGKLLGCSYKANRESGLLLQLHCSGSFLPLSWRHFQSQQPAVFRQKKPHSKNTLCITCSAFNSRQFTHTHIKIINTVDCFGLSNYDYFISHITFFKSKSKQPLADLMGSEGLNLL